MMNESKAGLNVIELALLMVLFTVGFIPGHLVAVRAGLLPGLGVGFVVSFIAFVTYAQIMSRVFPEKKRKLPE